MPLDGSRCNTGRFWHKSSSDRSCRKREEKPARDLPPLKNVGGFSESLALIICKHAADGHDLDKKKRSPVTSNGSYAGSERIR